MSATKKQQKKRRQGLAKRDSRGRVHLVLSRDLRGGESVALAVPVFKEDWQNELTAGTASTAHATLAGEPTVERTLELARSVMAATSRLTEGLLAHAPLGSVACRPGCDHCCYQAVGVTPPEALAIVDHLRRTRSAEALAALTAHVTELHEKARGKGANERFSPEHPCVFLEAARCSIYEARPLSCRGMNSLDAGECETRLHDPEARARFVATGAGSRSYLEPIRAAQAVSAGLQLALAELYDLDMRPLDLLAAMHLLLTGPDSIAADFVAGRSPLEAARSGEESRDPGLESLSGVLARPPER